MKLKSLTIIGFLFVCISASAQSSKKLYNEAEFHFYTERLDLALPLFEILANDGYKDSKYLYEIITVLLKYPSKPLTTLKKLHDDLPYEDPYLKYWLARIYARKNEFDTARRNFQEFLKENGDNLPKGLDKDVEMRMEMLATAERLIKIDDGYEIVHLPQRINSEQADLSPAFFVENNELLFMSSRDKTLQGETFKVFHSVNQDGAWPQNTPLEHLGVFDRANSKIEMVNKDGKLFIFNPIKGGDLFYSEGSGNDWANPLEYDSKITNTHLESHFFINDTEDRIIFASAQNNKSHGLDLFESYLDQNTGDWSKPVALPETVNGIEDEDSPYLSHDEQTLYFSSKGHGSMGGLDVFRSSWIEEEKTWSQPENMGSPINSTGDELHFEVNPDNMSGYYSSNRLNSIGDYDIYYFWEKKALEMKGQVTREKSGTSVRDAEIVLELSLHEKENETVTTDNDGSYSLTINPIKSYKISVIKDGNVVHSESFKLDDYDGMSSFEKSFVVDIEEESGSTAVTSNTSPRRNNNGIQNPGAPIRTLDQPQFVTSATQPEPPSYTLLTKAIDNNVYFSFDSFSPKTTEKGVIDQIQDFLKKNQGAMVEIAGHTDNIGDSQTNLWVSGKRAEEVRKLLIQAGISADRLIAKGYGESKPIASNDDELEGRELNRRIEVILIKAK